MQPSPAGRHQVSGTQRGSNVMYEVGTEFSVLRNEGGITQSDGITILYTLLQQLSAGWRVQQCMATAQNLITCSYLCSCCFEEHYSELIRFLEECANEGRRRLMELRKSNVGKDHEPTCHKMRDSTSNAYGVDNSGMIGGVSSTTHLNNDNNTSTSNATPAAVPRGGIGSIPGGSDSTTGVSLPLLQSLSLINTSSNGGIFPSSAVSPGGSSVVGSGAGTGTVRGQAIPSFFPDIFLSSTALVGGGNQKGSPLSYGIDSALNPINRSMNMKDVLSQNDIHSDPTALFNHTTSTSAYAPNIPPPTLQSSLQTLSHQSLEANLSRRQSGDRGSSPSSASDKHRLRDPRGSASSADSELTSISLDQETCGDLAQNQCPSSPQQGQRRHQSSSSQPPDHQGSRIMLEHHNTTRHSISMSSNNNASNNSQSTDQQKCLSGYWDSPSHYQNSGITANVGPTVVNQSVMSDVGMIWDHWFPAGQQSPQGLYRQGLKSPHQRMINSDVSSNYATTRAPRYSATNNNAQNQRKYQQQRKLSPQGSGTDAMASPSRRGLPHISTFLKADGGIPNFEPSPALFGGRDHLNTWHNVNRNWGTNGKRALGTWNNGFVDFADGDTSPGMTSQLPHISTSDLIGILRQYHKNEITRLEAKIRLHDVGSCKPCAFFHFPKKLCNSIKTCHFCHHEEHRRYSMKCWKRRRQRITKDITAADLETVNSLTNDVSLVRRESPTFYREADFIMACRSLKLSVEGSFPSSIKPLHQYYLKAEVIEMVEQGKMNVESINQDGMLPEEEIEKLLAKRAKDEGVTGTC